MIKVVVTGDEKAPKFFDTRKAAVDAIEEGLRNQRNNLHSNQVHVESIHHEWIDNTCECYYTSFWHGARMGEAIWRYTLSEVKDEEIEL